MIHQTQSTDGSKLALLLALILDQLSILIDKNQQTAPDLDPLVWIVAAVLWCIWVDCYLFVYCGCVCCIALLVNQEGKHDVDLNCTHFAVST